MEYKGTPVGQGAVDVLVEGRLVVERKAVEMLSKVHTAQVVGYLRAVKLRLGLLMNFHVPRLHEGIRRVVL